MRRREKSVITAFGLTLGFFLLQYIPLEWRPLGIIVFSVVAYVLTAWTLFKNLDGIEWITIVPLPAMYALSVAAFYFLLPESLIAQISILLIFGLGMYALLLAGNIFTIAKNRTIQLLRAAHAVLFFFSLIAALLVFNTVLSLGLWFVWIGGLTALASMILSFSFFWSIRLERRISPEVVALTFRTGFVVGFTAVALSFFPGNLWPTSLLLMSVMYAVLGLGQSALEERLFTSTVREYVGVLLAVIIMYAVMLPWK